MKSADPGGVEALDLRLLGDDLQGAATGMVSPAIACSQTAQSRASRRAMVRSRCSSMVVSACSAKVFFTMRCTEPRLA